MASILKPHPPASFNTILLKFFRNMFKGKSIAVAMPAYNAEAKIISVIKRAPKVYDKFIVVDDKSTDATLQVLKEFKPKMKKMVLLTHKKNKMYGGAQKTLYMNALKYNVDYVVLLHDDGQYPPEEMTKLLDCAIRNNADVVLGSRVLGGRMKESGMPFYKRIGDRFLTALENMAFGTHISEFHTGYRVYSKKALKKINWRKLTNKYYFDSEVILEALKNKLKIIEVPISINYRENVTAANPFIYGLEILYLITKREKIGLKK